MFEDFAVFSNEVQNTRARWIARFGWCRTLTQRSFIPCEIPKNCKSLPANAGLLRQLALIHRFGLRMRYAGITILATLW